MIKTNIFNTTYSALKFLGLRPDLIKDWFELVYELKLKGVDVFEFNPDSIQNSHWALLLDHKSIVNAIEEANSTVNSEYLNRDINIELKKIFSEFYITDSKSLNNLFAKIDLKGFFIPFNDIKDVTNNILGKYLNFYQLFLKHFDYEDFFSAISKYKIESKENENFIPFVIWMYVYHYSRFLKKVKKRSNGLSERWNDWFSNHFDLNDFHCRLPSEQVVVLLLIKCESFISGTENTWFNKRIHSKGFKNVDAFFINFEDEIKLLFGESEGTLNSLTIDDTQSDIFNKFVELFLIDSDVLLVQDLLDNRSQCNLYSVLPSLSQFKYGPNNVYKIAYYFKDFFSELNHYPNSLFYNDNLVTPSIQKSTRSVYIENTQYWFNLMPDERNRILDLIKSKSSSEFLKKIFLSVNNRRNSSLLNLLNLISAPILVWKLDDSLYPQWNVFEFGEAQNIAKQFNQEQNKFKNEKQSLEFHLNAIYKLEFKHELNKYLEENYPLFENEDFRLKWITEVKRLLKGFEYKHSFYESRMKEFGILEYNLGSNVNYLWMKEMLKIENEIRPFIQFVKKAFQTALPIRNRITFSNDRHVSDGVEFDPNTLFDQEKWIRADVMKVMESNIERGEAVQVNPFCLDFSGSMKHDRMRNLFKILYLLVLGLEDRKSYDAFHFFSNNFIEVVNFTDGFTNKKVLFQIMKQIASLQYGNIVFGGNGATNISEGISKSHLKMKKFSNDLISHNPKTNLVCSLFVITDGIPSLGITESSLLSKFIDEKRTDGDVEIKGIFIKSEEDVSPNLMKDIFGENNYVETSNFKEGVNKFVQIMTETYIKQRKNYKWKLKKQKLGLTD